MITHMQYYLSDDEINKLKNSLKTAIAVPFLDDIEDYIVEAIWEYTKGIQGVDPFYNTRSKKLYDVVDESSHIGWSVKSLQWGFSNNREFELVIQRADVFKKSTDLGFEQLDINSSPDRIGAALLKHWKLKVEGDATAQNVNSKRIWILLKTEDKRHFAALEEDIHLYTPSQLTWRWTNSDKNGLQGIRKSDQQCVYRWYPSQKQFFERFILTESTQQFDIDPIRLGKEQVVNLLLPHLSGQQ